MNDEAERKIIVSQAAHSAVLEGLTVSADFATATDGYIAGTMTADDLVAATRDRLGLEPGN
jgi:hypothetical protein